MKDQIEAYLKDQENAWSPSTLKSERSRLHTLAPYMELEPKAVYEELKAKGIKPYTIKTAMIRLGALESWIGKTDHFKKFMSKYKNRFKHVYQKEELKLTYEDAVKRIQSMPNEKARAMAIGLLMTGLRTHEAYKVVDGAVEGKGGKVRKVFGTIEETLPRSTFARHLALVGLKPHSLRKLCATRLVDQGATVADLLKVFGWSSINTALSYLQSKDDERLEAFVKKAVK